MQPQGHNTRQAKKIARSIFKKDLKCGNIFMHLEEEPNINNKIAPTNNAIGLARHARVKYTSNPNR